MAKKVLLQDLNNVEILPITRGELILDSSGKLAFHSNEFLATTSQPGLLSAEDKFKIDTIEEIGNIANNKVEQINTTTSDIYRLLFSETADDETRTEGARKSAKLTFNPSTGVLQASALIGNIDGTYINKLTGYTKATLSSDITPEDTLISALGKVELRAEIAYNLIQGAYDGDGIIENLNEILKVLDGISDTETIQAIIGKYLPLSGGTINGNIILNGNITITRESEPLYINSTNDSYPSAVYFFKNLVNYGGIGMSDKDTPCFLDTNNTPYTLIHSGNIGSYNAGSATKLQTARTIWGQPFDGTGDVDGYMFMEELDVLHMDESSLWLNYGGSNKGKSLRMCGTDTALYYGAGSNFTRAMTINSSGNVTIGASDLAGTSTKLYVDGTCRIVGDLTASSFIKSGSSDSYILLGGGGHKAISDFMLKSDELTNNLTTISKTLTVTQNWMDTGIKYTDLTTGTYAVQVYSHATNNFIWCGYWSGIMTWYGDTTNSSEADEILLHRGAHAYNDNTIYLRTINTVSSDGRHMRLQIAASKNFSSATYTFKFKKLI